MIYSTSDLAEVSLAHFLGLQIVSATHEMMDTNKGTITYEIDSSLEDWTEVVGTLADPTRTICGVSDLIKSVKSVMYLGRQARNNQHHRWVAEKPDRTVRPKWKIK